MNLLTGMIPHCFFILFAIMCCAQLAHVHASPAYTANSARAPAQDSTSYRKGTCKNPIVRKEWRALSDTEKKAYISAVQCLQRFPPLGPGEFANSTSSFEDFLSLHITLTPVIHLVGHFLPWHRRFVGIYEAALREKCAYKGANPYWDWTIDAASPNFTQSPVFSPTTGFGGFDTDAFGCLSSGPFAEFNITVASETEQPGHCLKRGFQPQFVQYLTTAQVANTTVQPTFELFRVELEGRPITPTAKIHDSGHHVVGGEMNDRHASPSDPLFYLHHANLDRIWWEWQTAAPGRLSEISGRATLNPPYVNVTLEYPLDTMVLADTVTIGDVMNIMGGTLCYTYA